MSSWKTMLILLISTGVTTTNCVKVGLAQWFANGHLFFNKKKFSISILLPLIIIFGAYFMINEYIQKPEMARRERAMSANLKNNANLKKLIYKKQEPQKYSGAIMNGETFKWTDIKLSRIHSIVENMFGESIMFHDNYLLHDVNKDRPIFVSYSIGVCYFVAVLILVLLLLGMFVGFSDKFMKMCISCFCFDIFLHLILGFGLIEIYIMTSNWAAIIPISVAYLFKKTYIKKQQNILRFVVTLTTIFLLIYNWRLFYCFMIC